MSAVLSPCGTYRYRLERRLVEPVTGPTVAWIMVNPSTADAEADDATIRKVSGFSRRLGFRRILVGNLFAYRATDVRALRNAPDPIGSQNNAHVGRIMSEADTHIVAWGSLAKLPGALRSRWFAIDNMAGFLGIPLMCLGTASDGHPLHPLMLGYERELRPWRRPETDLPEFMK